MEVVRGSPVLRVHSDGITRKGLAARRMLLPCLRDYMRRTPIGYRVVALMFLANHTKRMYITIAFLRDTPGGVA